LRTRMEARLRREGMPEDFFAIDPRFGSQESAERGLAAGTLVSASRDFGPAFAAKDWVLMKTDAPHRYLIGDHPLVLHNSRYHGPRGSLGLNVDGIEIYFPLSPQFTLGMMCGSHRRDFEERLQRMSQSEIDSPSLQKAVSIARDFIGAVKSGYPSRIDPENVEFLNSLQVTRAERFVFSADGDFSLVRSMIAEHPDLRVGVRIEEATGKF
jgi:hypothetical protein